MVKDYKINSYGIDSENGIAKNNLVINEAIFLKKEGAVVDKAGAGVDIVGVSYTIGVFSSNNEAKDKKVVNFAPKRLKNQYIVTIKGGNVTVADENKKFNLKTEKEVDGATAGTGAQLKLVKFLNTKKGVFEIL